MLAVRTHRLGALDNLVLEEVPSAPLLPGHVRIRIRATGINFADVLMVKGLYQEKPPLPFSPGIEVAGEVLELAPDVKGMKPGDRVFGMLGNGGLATEAVVPAPILMPIPEGIDFVTAAAFPVAYGTSHVALSHRAGLKAGETLLVLGAAGGVGLTAVEIGALMGAKVIAAASTPDKLEVARSKGATHLINSSSEDLKERTKALTDGRGVDVVYDPVGGALFDAALRSLAFEGRIVIIGFASGTIPQIPANLLLVKNIAAIGLYWGSYSWRRPEVLRRSMGELAGWLASGRIAPHVSETRPLSDAVLALRALEERRSTGKVVVVMDETEQS